MKVPKLLPYLLFLVLLGACQAHPLETARKSVEIGILREDAVEILSTDSWYHQPCPNLSSLDDLFFYGSHQYSQADVVIVTSIIDGGEYRVSQISSFEPYAWQIAYQDCIDLNRFED